MLERFAPLITSCEKMMKSQTDDLSTLSSMVALDIFSIEALRAKYEGKSNVHDE